MTFHIDGIHIQVRFKHDDNTLNVCQGYIQAVGCFSKHDLMMAMFQEIGELYDKIDQEARKPGPKDPGTFAESGGLGDN